MLLLSIYLNQQEFPQLPVGFITPAHFNEYFSSVLESPSHALSPAVKTLLFTPPCCSLSILRSLLCSVWTPMGCDINSAPCMRTRGRYPVERESLCGLPMCESNLFSLSIECGVVACVLVCKCGGEKADWLSEALNEIIPEMTIKSQLYHLQSESKWITDTYYFQYPALETHSCGCNFSAHFSTTQSN